ncbi:MAG TPA: tetratricopeptide repeat protein, partial [Myxococcaceae bacterium]|nr:tetratricopeptide repeat protein [Myxococcaceae bacterium]
MVANPVKPLSPADLAKLEHAFATNPTSEAYKPLAEAYLGMGRFMEAMVVCKKGVKAHPGVPDARILLAKVYAQQGKEKKALEELVAGLQLTPANKELLRATAELQLKTGSTDEGRANLLKSHQLDAKDPETLALMSQWKVEPPNAPPPVPPPVLSPKPIPLGTPVGAQKAQAQATRLPATDGRPAAPIQSEGPSPRGNRSGQRGSPSVAAAAPQWDLDAQVEIAARELHRKKGNRGVFLFLLLLVPIAVGGYFLFGRWKAQRNRDIKKYLTEATEQLRHDSYSSYKKASEAADKVLELDPTSTAAHGYLAYSYAVRWGEHGGGENARRLAEEHLAAAKKGGEISSHLYAADALILAQLGKSSQAAADLEKQIKEFDAQGRASPLMYLTLGLIQSNASDFEHARESLEKAQSLAPDDPRVYAALGTLYRRRGQDSEALKNFDSALRYERDHPESLLGKALLILQFDRPDYAGATKLLKKLLDADPPPSPRQLATAYLARALLVSRVSKEMPEYKPEHQRQLSESTEVPTDKAKAQAEVIK